MDTARTSDDRRPDRTTDRSFRDRIVSVLRPIVHRFWIDTRALAAFRIALGATILSDLAFRAGDLGLFYTDSGLYPLDVHEAVYGSAGTYSLYALSDALWVQATLFLVAGCVAFAFLVGYRTRLVGAVSLVFLLSLHVRNPAVLNGSDRLLWVLLLIGLLTPLGERWSVDSLRRSAAARETALSVGTVALLTQPLVVFTSNAIRKARGEHWFAGDALSIALANDAMTRSTADLLSGVPPLVTGLNYVWVALLAGSVPLLLGTSGRVRTLTVSAYLAAFAGMAATMVVGLFPFVLAASVLPFLPASAWDRLERRVPKHRIADRTRHLPFDPERPFAGPFRIGDRLRSVPVRPFGRSSIDAVRPILLSAVAVVVLVWLLTFAAFGAVERDLPSPLDADALDQQEWGLYAPDPQDSYSRYVIEAELESGDRIDALDGGPVRYDRPPDDGARHRSFMETVAASTDGSVDRAVADRYAQWACERAATHAADVERVALLRLRHTGLPDGPGSPHRSIVVESSCR